MRKIRKTKRAKKKSVAELLAPIENELTVATNIPELLGKASEGLRIHQRESRAYLRGVLQIGAIAATILLSSRSGKRRFLASVAVKKDPNDYSKMLPLVLGVMFTAKDRPDRTKVNRYTRALLELDERGIPVHSIADGIKSAGGIETLARERAAKRKGDAPEGKRIGATITIGAKRLHVSAEDLIKSINPRTRKARIFVRYKMNELNEPVVLAPPKIKPDPKLPAVEP